MPLPVLIYERKTNDYEPGRMRNMNIHQINAARCANYGLEFILFLLLTCYQQPQYELEKAVARPHEGFLYRWHHYHSHPNQAKITQKSWVSLKRIMGAERTTRTPKDSVSKKHKKYSSKNAYSSDICQAFAQKVPCSTLPDTTVLAPILLLFRDEQHG